MSHPLYQQTIEYLYASQPAFHLVGATAYKPGLDNTYRLMAHLGNPHTLLPAVHIAGTNGKGSTSHLIAAALQAQGYRVGLFTSPHLVDFRERIRISGEMIPEEEVVRFVAANRAFLDEIRPSFFETTMALAFWYFAEQKVDIAVIEVGLGGRLDSTNILTPLLSVITNIGIDHTEFLGNTLAEIAAEKAGIIKQHTPCVIGETHPETQAVFLNRARECDILGDGLETTNCRLWFADQCGFMRKRRLKEAPNCQLKGIYQDKNQQTAFVALQVLRNICGIALSKDAIAHGFAQVSTLTGLRGRWEVLSQQPLTICDTGHNTGGIKYIVEQLSNISYNRLHMVIGMVNDKDIRGVLSMLPKHATYYFTKASVNRALHENEVQRLANEAGLEGNTYPNVEEALKASLDAAHPDDFVFVGGSTFIVADLLSIYHKS